MESFLKNNRNKLILAGLSLPVLVFLCRHYFKRKARTEVEETKVEETKVEEEEIEEEQEGRQILPTNVRPKEYDVELTPNFTSFECPGKVKIKLDIVEQTRSIVLNCKDIDFTADGVELTIGANSYTATHVKFSSKQERATLSFESAFLPGEANLTIKFSSKINEPLHGFYRSQYTKNGEKRWMGTTQFEATHCREVFPCWDEPEIKAVFRIILNIPSDRMALSNMPIIKEENISDSVKRLVFDESPIMSTYLLAWVIGEFDYTETKTKHGTIIRVYTQEGKKEQGTFALDVAKGVLEFFSDYFAEPFPLPKLDMIAIPDFAAGAMENWGLVTYRDTALLWTKDSSAQAKERVAYVVAHELAHQWFGNLVSPSWWKYLWLNEGFATWAGNMAVDKLFPDWDTWTKFVSGSLAYATAADSLENSHPVEVDVDNAGQVSEIFDAISYHKGSSVIRMLANHLGEDNFRAGLRTYLSEKKYSCATTEDLWRHCSEASGQNVPEIMDNWIKVTGYPYVKATVSSSTESSICVTLTQEKFLAKGGHVEGGETWYCPIGVRIGVGETQKVQLITLNEKKKTFTLDLPDGCTSNDAWWIKFNKDSSSFLRVMYDKSLSERLSRNVITMLNPIDRLSIQTDVFALAQAGYTETSNAIKLAASYRDEKNYSVWSDLNSSLKGLLALYSLEEEPYAPLLKEFIHWLYQPIVDDLSWEAKEGEEQGRTLLRPLVIKTIGSVGSQTIIEEARRRFNLHIQGKELIPSDMRPTVFSLVLSNEQSDEYDEMIKLYHGSKMQADKVAILRLLGSSKNPGKIRRTIDFTFSENVRSQDAIYGFLGVTANPKGKAIAWEWMKENWQMIEEKFGGGQFMLPNFIKVTCQGFASFERLEDIKDFFEGKNPAGAARTIKQVCEKVELNAKRLVRDREDVKECLTTKFWET